LGVLLVYRQELAVAQEHQIPGDAPSPTAGAPRVVVPGCRHHKVFGIDGTLSPPHHEGEEKAKIMSATPLPVAVLDPSPAERKRALEDLLRARRLQAGAPPLRGEDRRLRPLSTGIDAVDVLLEGGFPHGALSEIHGPASSGRTGVLLALLARTTRRGALAALVDPLDRLDPASASAAGADLSRLLWLRGPRNAAEDPPAKALADATAAVATLAGSGLFDLVALDLVGADRERRRLPATTWLRLQRLVEDATTAVVLVADGHVTCGPGGVALALEPGPPRWSGPPGPARLLEALAARARAGRHGLRSAELALATL
jgi:recombination protein RecA